MLVLLLSILTLLSALCECSIVGDNYTYYYHSEYRPPNGWHQQGGAYRVVNTTSLSVSTCSLGGVPSLQTVNAPSVTIVAPIKLPWSKANFTTAFCHFGNFSVFVTHCTTGTSRNCTLTPPILAGYIVVGANGSITYNYTLRAIGDFSHFHSFQCVSNFTSVYLNGKLVFTSNLSLDVLSVGACLNATGAELKFSKYFNVLAYFINGTAHDVILCDDSPKGVLACQYNTGNFTDGFYPISVSTKADGVFNVYRTNSVLSYGYLRNITLSNCTAVEPNSGGELTLCQQYSVSEGYVNFNFSFLDSFTYVGPDFYNFDYGSSHSNCHFTPNTINNRLSFNTISVAIGYGPIDGACKQIRFRNGFNPYHTCCYAYKHPSLSHTCRGVTTGKYSNSYECVLMVVISRDYGSRVQTQTEVPTSLTYFYNNITLDVCVDYNIYGTLGQGYVTNITDMALSGGYLGFGGLVILDSSGAIDIFLVESENGPNYYKINPCNDVNQQYVVSGGSIVGLLTSNNLTGSELLEDQFYVKFANNVHRHRRSISENVTSCPYPTYGKFCIKPDGSVSTIVPEEVKDYTSLLLNRTDYVLIPDSFNLTVTDEFIQTQMQQVQINCIQYVCGNSIQCKQLFRQYGPVCDSILFIVNGIVQQDNAEILQFYSSTKPKGFDESSFSNFTAGEFNISLVLPKNGRPTGRSFIEDLLFDKVESLGLPGDSTYQKCTSGPLGFVKDLVCAQKYNGLLVLPPIITAEMQAMYTSSLVASMAFGGITAAGAIPFATQLQARINHLGITQTVLQKNQEKIAASFNKAMVHMQDGFKATSLALQQVQDVVNEQGAILQQTMHSLNKNFGAITHVIQDIYKQLDALEANAQVDRLINGRLSSLSVLASSKQLEYTKVSHQRELAKEKINECVKSQSSRYGFCGDGMHIMSIPQSAPNGIVFLHFTYTPVSFQNVTAVVGFCVKPVNGSEYGLVPVVGRGVFIEVNGTYYITSRDMYNPRAITGGDVVKLVSCQANYQSINRTVITTFVDEDDFNFDHELSKWWNETSRDFPDLDQFNYTIPVLNISNEIDRIQEVIQGLNDSLIDLETLSILKTYIKWPWYVWLAIFFAIIIFILILGWVFFMTGCCGCCCGCFGIIPLMSKCGKKSSYYTTFDNDVVTEQYRPKKSV
nr:Spike glycoprotein [Infectious bronchitis virus]